MKIANDAYWQIFMNVNANTPMGIDLVERIENWANAMELLMAKSFSLSEVLESTSARFFDPSLGYDKILLASAVNALIMCWEYGLELKALFDQGWLPAISHPRVKIPYIGNDSRLDIEVLKK